MDDRVNILLVDDQPSKLLTYEVMLGELGETLITAQSAREALGVLLKTDVALILIDVCMPDLDGFELAETIREHPRFRKTAIIFVSAFQVSDLDRRRGYEAGAIDYVSVPVVPELLRAKVRVFAELFRKTRDLERINAELEDRVAERTAALEASSLKLLELNQDLEERIEDRTRERETALAQLFEAQKMETIGQLTGGVAHDFNNLLMAITGSLELLKKRIPDDPRMHRLLDTAMHGSERGAALTQRLLAFSRRQELRPEAVDVVELIDGMRDLLARAVGPGLQLERIAPDCLPNAEVDANQLELAILNLALNARDAMPSGGALTISIAEEALAATRPGQGLPAGDFICVSITDTGEGMDEETLARALEPFFTTKGVGKGTGLGLSMAHGLAAQSGGDLRIVSKRGCGTTVHLRLPVASPSTLVRRVADRVADSIAGPSCTVLLVDDDPLVKAGTAAMLEDLGHTVRQASSAAEAMEALRSEPFPDLVLTDHVMPETTGLTLARQLGCLHPNLPVIIASGYAELFEVERSAGIPKLSKPFRQGELVTAMNNALSRARQRVRSSQH